MAEPRSTAQEASDPSTTPERLLELTEKHPQLQKSIVLNPSCPEIARKWILATNPWAKKAYEESVGTTGSGSAQDTTSAGAAAAGASGGPAATGREGSSAAAGSSSDAADQATRALPVGGPPTAEHRPAPAASVPAPSPAAPDDTAVWGTFSETDAWGGTTGRASVPPSASAPSPVTNPSTEAIAADIPGSTNVRVSQAARVVPLGPQGAAGAAAAGAAGAAAGAQPAAPGPNAAYRPAGQHPSPAPSPAHAGYGAAGAGRPSPSYAAPAPAGSMQSASQQPGSPEPAPGNAWAPVTGSQAAPAAGVFPAEESTDGEDPGRDRRRSWLACGGCLVLVLVVLLVGVLGGRAWLSDDEGSYERDSSTSAAESPSEEPSEEPTTEEPTEEDPVSPAPDGAQERTELHSPTGNIICKLEENSVACSVVERDFSGSSLEDCDAGPFSIQVGEEETGLACGKSFLSDSATSMEYDQSAKHGNVACTSRFDGMTCWNVMTGHGFMVNKVTYSKF